MITPSFGLTATERVLPKLALDFTTASLDSRVTFTRTTGASNPATYVNSSGYIFAATNNQPRFDYNPTSLICNGLLIEEARTNLITYSEAIGGTNWTVQAGATASLNNATSPANTTTATLLTGTTAVATFQSITLIANTSYTISIFAKAGTSTRSSLGLLDTTGGDFQGRLFITWSSGVPSTQSTQGTVTNVTYTPYSNGWYKIAFTTTSDITNTTHRYYFYPDTLATGGTVYVWGTQLEAGAFATSYIPTTTTALTRNADVATMTGTNLTNWCDTTKGTILSQHMVAQFNAANTIYAYSLGSAAAVEVYAGISAAGANQFTVINTTNQANFAGFATGTLNTPQKVCGYYQANNFAASANGVAGGTDLSGTVPTINKLVFGARNDGARIFNGWVQKFLYWPFNLTTAEVTAFSKQ